MKKNTPIQDRCILDTDVHIQQTTSYKLVCSEQIRTVCDVKVLYKYYVVGLINWFKYDRNPSKNQRI